MTEWSPPLLLASGSARRRMLLDEVGGPVEVCAPEIDEGVTPGTTAADAVLIVARRKAAAAAGRHPGRAVLAADTLVAVGETLLGKPVDTDDARRMLRLMSGRWHRVLTGVVLITAEGARERVATTRVRFAALDEAEIDRYVAGSEPYDKAGGYGIQGAAGWFVAEIRGSYSNVMGLPLEEVRTLLTESGLPLPRLGA